MGPSDKVGSGARREAVESPSDPKQFYLGVGLKVVFWMVFLFFEGGMIFFRWECFIFGDKIQMKSFYLLEVLSDLTDLGLLFG